MARREGMAYHSPLLERCTLCSRGCLTFFVLLLGGLAAATGATEEMEESRGGCAELANRCPVPEMKDIWKHSSQQCPLCSREGGGLRSLEREEPTAGVAELNETSLSTLLEGLRSGSSQFNYSHVAVLYYANWCPFSRTLRPTYEALAVLHPSTFHVAVEEQRLRPSVLSRVGVHSFPALHIHNRTGRIKYQGPRTLADLQRFYVNITGLGDVDSTQADFMIEEAEEPAVGRWAREPCPYPWAHYPQQLLQEHMCLLLATAFVLLRVVWWAAPRAAAWIKSSWRTRHSREGRVRPPSR